MRRLRRAEIERRLAICEAYQQDPTLRYVDLQARFHAGPSIVASALKGGAGTWLRMLGKAPARAEGTPGPPTSKPAGTTKWEYLAVEVSSVESAEGAITYQARDDDEEQPGITGVTTMADVLGAYGKLGWELAGVEKVGKGGVKAWCYFVLRRTYRKIEIDTQPLERVWHEKLNGRPAFEYWIQTALTKLSEIFEAIERTFV